MFLLCAKSNTGPIGEKMNILIVDDEELIRKNLGDFLKRVGHSVWVSEEEEEAMKILKDRSIDVGIFDLALRESDGIRILCRARIVRPHAKYIIITGVGNMWNAAESFHCGAFSFIKKPLDMNELLDKLNQIEKGNKMSSDVEKIRSS